MKIVPGSIKSITCSRRKIFLLNILKTTSLSTLLWLESKFYSGTLPTMHSIYQCILIYIKDSKFLQTAVYIYMPFHGVLANGFETWNSINYANFVWATCEFALAPFTAF